MAAQFTRLTSTAIPLPFANVDTDQIIPARFLKVTDKAGLGKVLFADWRYQTTVATVDAADNAPEQPDFVINQPQHQGAQIILAGDNFGCGSSREHAPWALLGWGVRVILSTSFADIFSNNALKNGLLPIVVSPEQHQTLFDLLEEVPHAQFSVDLDSQTVTLPDGSQFDFEVDSFYRTCLLNGVDQIGYVQNYAEQIAAFEAAQAR